MVRGKEIWNSADKLINPGRVKSANAMRFYALTQMLAEAELSALTGSDDKAARQLRLLVSHAEKLLAMLAPDQKQRPLVAAE
jgi:hypothetical protein